MLRRVRCAHLAVGVLFLISPAWAQDAGVCKLAPNRETALKLEKVTDEILRAMAGDLSKKRSLVTLRSIPGEVRASVPILQCHEPSLSSKEQQEAHALEAHWLKWADDEDAMLASEQKARTDVILPLCEAVWGALNAQAAIDHEKSNPSGVVDLRALHDAGESLRYYRDLVAKYRPLYRAARHHDFTRWQDEGACVEDAEASQAQ